MSQDLWGEEEAFSDRPDEIEIDSNGIQKQSPPVNLPRQQVSRPTAPPRLPPPVVEEEYYEETAEEVIEEDFSDVLNDANLRIEQGRLYQMIMNHPLFEGMDADPRAIQNVEREIKKFARESMEVMLGMRQTMPARLDEVVSSPFNDLEVEILKKIASQASNGATESAAANEVAKKIKETPPPKRATLNTIGGSTQKKTPAKAPTQKPLQKAPAAPIKRTKLDLTIDQIAREEGIPRELLEEDALLLGERIHNLTPDEMLEYNKAMAKRNRKAAPPPNAIPMPSYDQQVMLAEQHAAKASNDSLMSQIISKAKQMPIRNNE